MSEKHEHGSMDTTEHEKMFATFINFTVWTVAGILVALILLYMIGG